ncbi:phosphate acetyltransferase [Labilibacter sediminis]|nr:phosphate acetyltransferase [Labilibacter sediminis]
MDIAITKLEQIARHVIDTGERWRVAVVMAEDANTMGAVVKACTDGFIFPIFIGNKSKIQELLAKENTLQSGTFSIIECNQADEAAKLGVQLIKNGDADIIMKGLIGTDLFLKAVMQKQKGLMKTNGVLSYVCALEIPKYHKLLLITDPAVIPFPNQEQKVAMARYAINMAHQLGVNKPKVALIGASEKVSPHFPNSREYKNMCEMASRGEIKNCLMDGPLDLFLACDKESVKVKGAKTPINGDADVLLFPTLEACNPFYKGIMLFGNGELAGLIQGTTHPVVVMSRSESFKSKYYCLALACLTVKDNH